MATKYARIPEIKEGVVFSDPSYDGSVWCQYRENFKASNWLMKMDTRDDDGTILFELYMGRPTMCVGVSLKEVDNSFSISFPGRYTNDSKELGIDTAQIFCGSKTNWDLYRNEACIYTGADGLFGDLMIFRCKGETEPAGFLLLGAIDGALTSEDELFRNFYAGFDGFEISKEKYNEITNINSLSYKLSFTREIRHASNNEVGDMSAKESQKGNER